MGMGTGKVNGANVLVLGSGQGGAPGEEEGYATAYEMGWDNAYGQMAQEKGEWVRRFQWEIVVVWLLGALLGVVVGIGMAWLVLLSIRGM